MPKDKNITKKLAFYKHRRKQGMTNEQIKVLWDAKQAEQGEVKK